MDVGCFKVANDKISQFTRGFDRLFSAAKPNKSFVNGNSFLRSYCYKAVCLLSIFDKFRTICI